MLTRLKQNIQEILTKQARIAHRLHFTPNTITIASFILAALSAVTYTQAATNTLYLIPATTLMLLSGYMDALDGALARIIQQTTAFGGYLDSVLDRYSDALIIAAITAAALCPVTWGLAAIIGAMTVSYTRARAEAAGAKMETIGIAERPERIVILAITSIMALIIQTQAIMVVTIGIIILAVLTNLTVVQRSIHAYRQLRQPRKEQRNRD